MKISIVILNWNGAAMLQRFLPSVLEYSAGSEVVVADNGSTDDSLQVLMRDFPCVRTIVLDRNYGFAEGYNVALRQVDSDVYILLNSDVRVTSGWLEPLIGCLEAHPEVAALQPKIRCEWSPCQFEYAGASGGFIDRLGYPYCRGRLMSTVETDNGQYDDVLPVFWATGAALVIRSTDYWSAGGLDGRFFAHQEEIDLCWRLRSRGRGILCVPQSVVYHLGGGTLPQGSPRKTFLNFRNNLLLLYKNMPERHLQSVMRIRFWLDALASLQMFLTGQWGSAKAVWRARHEFARIKADFQVSREENLAKSVLESIPEQASFSLLWQYYVLQRKTFDLLP
ncbi:MAG: glycosyltransferase family 2 protein [Bacteroidaceae bacterium]